MNFDQALAIVLLSEGGFVDHPRDPGGVTNYGITVAVARAHGYTGDMRTIDMPTVARIYKASYWDAVLADKMPVELRYPLFDAAVNSGPKQAIQWLQRALGVPSDGSIGPVTLEAVRVSDPGTLARKMIGQRLRFMTDLKIWPTFGRGWARRIADLLEA